MRNRAFRRFMQLPALCYCSLLAFLVIGWMPEDQSLQYSVQLASFKGMERKTRYEIYFAIPERELEYISRNGETFAEVAVDIAVDNARMQQILQKNEVLIIPASKNRKSTAGYFIGQSNFEIGSDLYTHILTFRPRLRDKNSGKAGSRLIRLDHKDYNGTELQISDLQFASDITEELTEGIFQKGPYKVVPYPPEYNIGQRVLYVYFELYGLGLDALGYANYIVDYSVVDIGVGSFLPFVDTWGKPFATDSTKEAGLTAVREDRAQKGKDQREFTSIDLSLLYPGQYRFQVRVRDLVQEKIVQTYGEFAVGTNQVKQ